MGRWIFEMIGVYVLFVVVGWCVAAIMIAAWFGS
jgi:hypothetical protein